MTARINGAPEYRGVVVGCSAGGMEALTPILGRLPERYPLPVFLVQHLHKSDEGRFAEHLGLATPLAVSEALDKEPIAPAHVYVAPADYHMLVERTNTIALSIDPKVNWSRPSIDVLFESAARAWGAATVGVLLSGANHDGARGMQLIGAAGGLCVAQDPQTARSPVMPRAAIELARVEAVLAPEEIGEQLARLGETTEETSSADALREETR